MCSCHQSYLSCSFERLQQVSATAFARFASVRFSRKSTKVLLCVLKLHYFCFIASLLLFYSFIFVIFVAYLYRKYTFYLRFVESTFTTHSFLSSRSIYFK